MPSLRALLYVLCLAEIAIAWSSAFADEPTAKKYALLIGVSRYEHAEMNRPQPLEFPEEDARALATVLAESGYKTLVLVGEDAKRARIVDELAQLKREANDAGSILVGFFGHGVEYQGKFNGQETAESYFCPYDVELRVAKDSQGRTLFTEGKQEMVEPDPDTAIGMTEVFTSLRLSKAGRRIVLADCCRNDPNAARGRSFGANVKISDLPERTAALFACSSGEKAFEDKTAGHGVFTQAVLERIREHKEDSPLTAALLGEHLEMNVPKRVSKLTKGREKQTPRYLSINTVDLQLLRTDRRLPPPIFNFADSSRSESEALAAQQAWAKYTGQELFFSNSIGMQFRLLPPGEFMMGSNDSKEELKAKGFSVREDFDFSAEHPQHRVQITKPFCVGVHEVTLSQFLKYYNADRVNHKTDAEKDGKGGSGFDGSSYGQKPEYVAWNTGWNKPVEKYMNHPVVNVSWNDAVGFCEWLSKGEGREYRLLTEAEWEYACKSGANGTLFSFGSNYNEMVKFCNIGDMTAKKFFGDSWGNHHSGEDGYVHTSVVGSFPANSFGLYDMHGNVHEWCADGFDSDAYSSRGYCVNDPFVKEGSYRVVRGGSWDYAPIHSRSAQRDGDDEDKRSCHLGFRVCLQSVR